MKVLCVVSPPLLSQTRTVRAVCTMTVVPHSGHLTVVQQSPGPVTTGFLQAQAFVSTPPCPRLFRPTFVETLIHFFQGLPRYHSRHFFPSKNESKNDGFCTVPVLTVFTVDFMKYRQPLNVITADFIKVPPTAKRGSAEKLSA